MSIQSEDQILAVIDAFFPRRHPSLLLGRGDDCAEFASASPLALSTDLSLDDVHFRSSYFSPEEIGHKVLAVNLSDLAAAGAVPLGFSLGFICPRDLPLAALEGLFRGMAALAAAHDIPLSGGDITVGDKLGFSITVWGGAARDHSGRVVPFLRRGAVEGDVIFFLSQVEGAAASRPASGLGLARLGLEVLEKGGRAALRDCPAACAALLKPRPQLAAGWRFALLAAAFQDDHKLALPPLKVMDVSDGLRRDLPRLLDGYRRLEAVAKARHGQQPGRQHIPLGADLDFPAAALHPEVLRAWRVREDGAGLAPALEGGDEYGLLCACVPGLLPALVAEAEREAGQPASLLVLGRVSAAPGIRWRGKDIGDMLPGDGFDHFSR
ncbi:MAG: thiamine-phosphate kinase [Deltaproteobacteria bacterium]|jgi:thiamine-monophosphate kinase|nr:thiamine-phosphate kinase [Deltaproteobacteria bacterium]